MAHTKIQNRNSKPKTIMMTHLETEGPLLELVIFPPVNFDWIEPEFKSLVYYTPAVPFELHNQMTGDRITA